MPGARVDRRERPLDVLGLHPLADRRGLLVLRARLREALLRLEPQHVRLERDLRGALEAGVERRVDGVPVAVDRARAVFRFEDLPDVLAEVPREILAFRHLRHDIEGAGLERVALGLRDDAELLHRAEHDLHAPRRAFEIRERVVAAGILRQPRDQRDLIQPELPHRLAEVLPRGGLDAVRALAEVDLVEIHLEDLVLRVRALDFE